jgi:hypothetical protein
MNIAVCCSYLPDSLVGPLVRELAPLGASIHLWALESVSPEAAPWTRGTARLGKFQALNRLLPYTSGADLVLLVDDDVRLPHGFLPRYVSIIRQLGASIAQPALTPNSYHSHAITLQRSDCWARLTNFVEAGPVCSMTGDFLRRITPFLRLASQFAQSLVCAGTVGVMEMRLLSWSLVP